MAIVFQGKGDWALGASAQRLRGRVAGAPAARNIPAHGSFMFNAYLKVPAIAPM
jgi:hypothetical protein